MSINKNAVEMLCGEFSFNLRGEFESKVIEITPETAAKLLSFSEGNRNLKAAGLSLLINAIKENQFVVTNNAISFDENFVLRDGHHRLKAISVAGIPVKHAVSINIPFDNFQYVDVGTSRSQADILAIYATHKFDFPITGREVSLAKVLSGMMNSHNVRTSHHKIEKIMWANRKGIAFVCDNYATQQRGLSSAIVRAAIAASVDYVAPETLELFCMVLTQGVAGGLSTKSNAALFCREALMTSRLNDAMARFGIKNYSSSAGIPTRSVIYFVQWCIKQFDIGNNCTRIDTGLSKDKETQEISVKPLIYAPVSVI